MKKRFAIASSSSSKEPRELKESCAPKRRPYLSVASEKKTMTTTAKGNSETKLITVRENFSR